MKSNGRFQSLRKSSLEDTLENLIFLSEKPKIELKKVFNLLIIIEVKQQKYFKSHEFRTWRSKAKNLATRVESPMSEIDAPTKDDFSDN